MKLILKHASRLVNFVKPKKEAKKETSDKKPESKKEDKKPNEEQDIEINEATLKKILEEDKDKIKVNASGLELVLRGHEYKVRLTKPAHGARQHELLDALKRNRELLEKSADDLYRLHCGNINKNKEHNQMVDDISKGIIKPSGDKMKAAFDKILEKGKIPLDTWDENILRPGIQNALVARANIDLLIPLINVRGGDAEYKGLEALPINDHINNLRDGAAKKAAEELIPPPEPPKTDAWTIQEFLIAALIVIIITLLLIAFIP